MKNKKRKKIPVPVDLEISDRQYQPSRAELREEMDVPGLSLERVRTPFMRPFRFRNPSANCD